MKAFLGNSAIAGGILFGFILAYGTFCDYFFQKPEYMDFTEKRTWNIAQKGGNYDYAVLGSSRAFGAFDMPLLDSLTGWKGINLGANGSGFKDNYLVLTLFLKTNQVDRLLLQVDMGVLNSKMAFSNEFHAFTFFPFWEEKEVREVLQEEIPVMAHPLTELAPQWRYFYFNKYFSPKEVIRRCLAGGEPSNVFLKTRGGIQETEKAPPATKITPTPLPETPEEEDWRYLLKVKTLAEQAGVAVLFFSAPRYQDEQREVGTLLSQFPNRYISPEGFDQSNLSFFQDQGHLTSNGRKLFTLYMGKSFQESI
ncbi:hypothetical protein DFQ04_1409 [Algoriphagus boseongensis]|uniref:Uncharacterized protein n=1 Tax=Algoriphagus boseongensis TaxID=1442587 RepID=A0A4R6TA08_9BACT|nr:hypothetical protein [Algoriphagus boseongensis]TDQ19586.1 hypothetical protein DFQ04_1409 [Algoriphagus boseongensis]